MAINYHWQYPQEPENRILKADRYELVNPQPLFTTEERKAYKIYAKAIVNGRFPPADTDPVQDAIFTDGQEIECFTTGSYRVPIWNLSPNYDQAKNVYLNITHTGRNGGNLSADYCVKKTGAYPIFARYERSWGSASSVPQQQKSTHFGFGIRTDIGFYDYRFEDIGSAARPCLNELPSECALEFYQNSNLVYQRKEAICPTVWEEEEKCPPGTCEVECGAHICCYDPTTGIAVTSISK